MFYLRAYIESFVRILVPDLEALLQRLLNHSARQVTGHLNIGDDLEVVLWNHHTSDPLVNKNDRGGFNESVFFRPPVKKNGCGFS